MFDSRAMEVLGYYVYGLFDPNEPTIPFYIGKGQGNRVYAHASGDLSEAMLQDEPMSPKLELITDIKRRGQKVIQKIIRYELSECEALAVEASLIDLVNFMHPETLRNQISGQGTALGMTDAEDLAFEFAATPLSETLVALGEPPVLLIKIGQRWSALKFKYGAATAIPLDEIYEAVRASWRISIARAKRAESILAIGGGLVRAAFTADVWRVVEDERKSFEGRPASNCQQFVGKSVHNYFARGNQNPIRYLNC